jgi:hypothetical protein
LGWVGCGAGFWTGVVGGVAATAGRAGRGCVAGRCVGLGRGVTGAGIVGAGVGAGVAVAGAGETGVALATGAAGSGAAGR